MASCSIFRVLNPTERVRGLFCTCVPCTNNSSSNDESYIKVDISPLPSTQYRRLDMLWEREKSPYYNYNKILFELSMSLPLKGFKTSEPHCAKGDRNVAREHYSCTLCYSSTIRIHTENFSHKKQCIISQLQLLVKINLMWTANTNFVKIRVSNATAKGCIQCYY